MGKKKTDRKHNKVVLEAGEFLSSKNGYNIHVDSRHISKNKREKNGFKPPLKLKVPEDLLSAFVPTKRIFSKSFSIMDPNWKTPDLAVTRDGFTYVLDVLGRESSITMMARKFETFIANYKEHNIVGMAFIGISSGYPGKEKEFKRYRKTFNDLFGESSHGEYPECFWDVKSLFSNEFCQDIYGEIQWDKVKVINCVDVDDADWKETLCQHVDKAINEKTLLVEKQT